MKQTIKAMVTIAERGHGNDIAALYARKNVSCHYHCVGKGTASSELLDLFGFGTAERDILISLATGREIDLLLQELRDAWRTRVSTRGIVFSLSVRAMNNLAAAMEKYTGNKVVVKYQIKPEILGGLLVECGSELIDDSVKGKIDRLELLMKGTI